MEFDFDGNLQIVDRRGIGEAIVKIEDVAEIVGSELRAAGSEMSVSLGFHDDSFFWRLGRTSSVGDLEGRGSGLKGIAIMIVMAQ
jgi:hypothetical protein